jgi:hypothetical protein
MHRTGEFVYDHGEEVEVLLGFYCDIDHTPQSFKECSAFKERQGRDHDKRRYATEPQEGGAGS